MASANILIQKHGTIFWAIEFYVMMFLDMFACVSEFFYETHPTNQYNQKKSKVVLLPIYTLGLIMIRIAHIYFVRYPLI